MSLINLLMIYLIIIESLAYLFIASIILRSITGSDLELLITLLLELIDSLIDSSKSLSRLYLLFAESLLEIKTPSLQLSYFIFQYPCCRVILIQSIPDI